MMDTTYQGERKIIKAFGRMFDFCEESQNAVMQIEWARKKLNEPDVTFPNGRSSHEVANETLDKYELDLIEYQLFTA